MEEFIVDFDPGETIEKTSIKKRYFLRVLIWIIYEPRIELRNRSAKLVCSLDNC